MTISFTLKDANDATLYIIGKTNNQTRTIKAKANEKVYQPKGN